MGKANGKATHQTNGAKPHENSSMSSSSWLFSNNPLTIRPIAVMSLLVLFAVLPRPWEFGNKETICEIARTGESPDQWRWVEVPRSPQKTNYLAYPAGTFVLRHIYMDTFKEDFNVEPIGFSEIDPSVRDYLNKLPLREGLLNNTKTSNTIKSIIQASDKFGPALKKWKNEWESGTWVDDGSLYVRWVHPKVQWGMFAGRRFKQGELIGVYTGVYDRDIPDVTYAWEYNHLIQVEDGEGGHVRVFIDAKNKGNYLRFSNHRDSKHHYQQYVVFENKYHVLYIASSDIEVHDQIFVNYGSGYWETKDKIEL